MSNIQYCLNGKVINITFFLWLYVGGAKVCVLDKETFPRDKYCGDAVCTPALNILDDMNVLKEIKDNNEV